VQLFDVRSDCVGDRRDHRELERSGGHHNLGDVVGLTVGVAVKPAPSRVTLVTRVLCRIGNPKVVA
jgi:hypothetical protein